jgi:hypothetical protein
MFFRMLRLLAPVSMGKTAELSRCEQHAGLLHRSIAERAPDEREDPIIAWFLVQPVNIATGRLGSNPMIAVARLSGK